MFTWPGIELRDRLFNPILSAFENLTSEDGKSVQQQNRVARIPLWHDYTVNSRGQIISFSYHNTKYFVTNFSTDESKGVKLPDTKGIDTKGKAITFDNDNNVYVIVRLTSDEVGSAGNKLYDYLLFVFGSMKHKYVLDIFDSRNQEL